jgi:YfiR/HmsC-like
MARSPPADTNRKSRRRFLGLLLSSGALLLTGEAVRAAEVYSAIDVKAAFLSRFAAYVTWPRPTPADTFFTIAVLDGDAVAQELERLLAGRMINDLPTRVRSIRNIAELRGAQMLYIGSESNAVLGDIATIASQPVLVVTDTPDGLAAGSTINFLLVDRHVRFEVSLSAAARAGLEVSAGLLSVAARVEGDHRRSDSSCVPIEPTWTRCREWLASG